MRSMRAFWLRCGNAILAKRIGSRRLSIIDEAGDRYVRMAHLASVASRRINGVAALHSELLKHDVLRDFAKIYPDKFVNVTNGVTPRRWLAVSNPALADLITRKIGSTWLSNLEAELGRVRDASRMTPRFRTRYA